LGQIAAEVKPGILVLYHQLSWSLRKEIIAEIRENYDGPMAYGNDLDVF
jgi:ribonuclease BN (tRNA processing enzyme)